MTLANLGIIAGCGLLPLEIANIYANNGGKCYIAAICDKVDQPLIDQYSGKFFAIGQAGKIINYFKELNVRDIIIIGDIDRPDLKSIKVDLVGSKLMTRILKQKFLGDDSVLQVIANFLEEQGFKVISPTEILSLVNYNDSLETEKLPTKQDEIDIELGKKVLNSLGKLDVGQSVIVSNGYVLGIEAAEGTDNLIKRCSILNKSSGGVLVKIPKLYQDNRLDVPTIGVKTIVNLAEAGFSGVAIDKRRVLVASLEETKITADKYRVFISS